MANSIFETLNKVDCSKFIEKKNGLTYLSWANAWAELKKRYPQSFYTIYENASGLFYHTDGNTAWVKTGVTVVDGDFALEHIEYLPVMDFRNRSIPVSSITSFDVNKAIQRSLTKAVARHGLGLYIYAGEDLPESSEEHYAKQALPESERPQALTKIDYAQADAEFEQMKTDMIIRNCQQIMDELQMPDDVRLKAIKYYGGANAEILEVLSDEALKKLLKALRTKKTKAEKVA